MAKEGSLLSIFFRKDVETLRNPTEILKTLSEKSRDKSYRFQRLYRNLYNPEFYYLAYNNICTGQGNMTPGTDGETIDGMSDECIQKIIASLRNHSYQPHPARREYIAKKNSGKKRPLGIPSASDKLVQEVVRMILESIYEPNFSPDSHGFRPKRSCHTALKHIWTSATPEEKAQMGKALRKARNEMFTYPYYAQCNSGYKCLYYCRYADDFIISVIGSREDAERIKADVKDFLKGALKLEMSEEKTKITHSSDFARFLGYDICVSRSNAIKYNEKGVAKREYSGRIMMYVPKEKWMGKLLEYHTFKIKLDESGKEKWKTIHRGKLVNHPDIEIITKFNAEIRGLYNYYRLANNVSVLNKFAYIMEYSMYKTFACKYRSTVKKIVDKYSHNGIFSIPYQTKSGMKRCEFYHDGFHRIKEVLLDADTLPEYRKSYHAPRSNAARIKKGVCELCGQQTKDICMHHVRRMKDLTDNSDWEKLMKKMRRKSLAVCKACHDRIHG